MTKRMMGLWAALFVLGISNAGTLPALAADRTVSSVTLRINSALETGDDFPEISFTNESSSVNVEDGNICVSNSSSKYSITDADWSSSSKGEIEVGDQPTMEVRLSPNTVGNDDYAFKGTYRSSNVEIKNGSFVSAKKSGDDLVVKLRINPIKGTFAEPEDAYWKDNAKGTARWEEPENGGTGHYEVVLRRGSSKVHTVETTSRSYNFYPYMTSAGTYTFRVRTIAKTSREDDYGKSGAWVESDEIYLAKEDVSDGSGQNGGTGATGNVGAGWRYLSNAWYYYYPDGSYQKNGWLMVDGKWYLFANDGRMMTGWQNRNNQTYYLRESGDMVTGWMREGQVWYYLNPTKDGYEGCLLRSRWETINGQVYCFNSTGAMLEGWNEVDGNWYYFYPAQGHKAVNTWIDTFYVNQDGVWLR